MTEGPVPMPINLTRLKPALKIFFLYSVRMLVPYLPRYWVMRLAELSGSLDARGEKARITAEKVGQMLGPEADPGEIRRIVLASIREFHKDLFEIWCFPRLNRRRLATMASLEGREHLDAALARGKGAIVGVTHFGSFKMVIAALGYAGYKVHQVAVTPLAFDNDQNSAVNNIIMRIEYACERSLPAEFIYLGSFVRDIYRALARGDVVIMSLDGVERRKQIKIPLLHAETGLDIAPLLLAARRGVPFLPCFPLRQADDRHRVVIHPPLQADANLGPEEAAHRMALAYGRIMEEQVRAYPSHYARSLYVFATLWKEVLDQLPADDRG